MNEAQAFMVLFCLGGLYAAVIIVLSKLYDICKKLDELVKTVKRDD